jgi:hypothetical protein
VLLAALSFAITTAADSTEVCCRGINRDKALYSTAASDGVTIVRTTTATTNFSKYLPASPPWYHKLDFPKFDGARKTQLSKLNH